MESTIAVLLTCHNRKDKTLLCLDSFFKAEKPSGFSFDIFLVDDGSNDGTSCQVLKKYPSIKVIQGDGNLFWNKGMRLAWETAIEKQEYNFYLWLNDDTVLYNNAINELIKCSEETYIKESKETIITGAFKTAEKENRFSYGGRTDLGDVIPNGQLQQCTYINGNTVIIPNEVYKQIGVLSKDYTHTMGDFDYGLRAIEAGFKCYTTRKYIGICELNEEVSGWCNPKISIFKRLQLLHAPNGLNIKEYKKFRQRFWLKTYRIYIAKAYIKCIFPSLYNILKIKKK